jgi:hypothetical protein
MDRIEENVRRLLNGEELQESQEFCDFSLEAQNEATGKNFDNIFFLYYH